MSWRRPFEETLTSDPPPAGGSDAYYRHVQSSPASEWQVPHGLGKKPAVSVVDTSGRRVFGGVSYPSDALVLLTFSSPFSGEAHLN